jgi:hypothetical protein
MPTIRAAITIRSATTTPAMSAELDAGLAAVDVLNAGLAAVDVVNAVYHHMKKIQL